MMKLLQRYLIKTVLQAIGVVIIVLSCIEIFISFLNELHDIGIGNYHVFNAFIFSLMQLPLLIYQFFPFASLIGSLLGLGLLASHSELTVMRAVGLPVSKIASSVVIAGLLMLSVVTLMGETLAPTLQQLSYQNKAIATSGGQALPTLQGLWLHTKNSFVHIDEIKGQQLSGIRSYQLNDDQQLIQSLYAREANYRDKQWWLVDVSITELKQNPIKAFHYDALKWDMNLSPAVLSMSSGDPNQMPISYLYRLIRAHHQNYGEVNKYLLTFWSRLLQPFTTCVMVLIAIPFVFGTSRSVTISARIVWGVLLGFGFYILNQFFGPISTVLRIPPLLAAALPTLIFAAVGFLLVRRHLFQRWQLTLRRD